MSGNCDRTCRLIEQGIADGLHLGAQLYVSLRGQAVIDRAFGESRPGVPMSTDTINLWMSSVKPITAVAIGQLYDRGLLNWDNPVARFVPEFGVKGKDAITIRHVLTHTGGFRAVIGLQWSDPYEVAVEKVCNAPLEPRWIPGQTAGYHASSGWYALAEVARRIDGRRIDQFARESIFRLLGMSDCWLGMPVEQYCAYGDRIGMMYDTSGTQRTLAEAGNSEQDAAAVRPGANGRGPINQLAKFYEKLCVDDPWPLLSLKTGLEMTSPQRVGMRDLTFKHVMDFGLGFILNSNKYGAQTVPYGYGLYAGERTFGHSGQESSCAFCDPDAGLVAAWVCNGMPGDAVHSARQRAINTAIYEDVLQKG
jgi:CubicO group peptidase (beta-lactamase class C family)